MNSPDRRIIHPISRAYPKDNSEPGMTPDELIQSEMGMDDDGLHPTQALYYYEGKQRTVKGQRIVQGAGVLEETSKALFQFVRLQKQVTSQIITGIDPAGRRFSRPYQLNNYAPGVRPHEGVPLLKGSRREVKRIVEETLKPEDVDGSSLVHVLFHHSSTHGNPPSTIP